MNEHEEEGGREMDTTGMEEVTGGEDRGRKRATKERQLVIEREGDKTQG